MEVLEWKRAGISDNILEEISEDISSRSPVDIAGDKLELTFREISTEIPGGISLELIVRISEGVSEDLRWDNW